MRAREETGPGRHPLRTESAQKSLGDFCLRPLLTWRELNETDHHGRVSPCALSSWDDPVQSTELSNTSSNSLFSPSPPPFQSASRRCFCCQLQQCILQTVCLVRHFRTFHLNDRSSLLWIDHHSLLWLDHGHHFYHHRSKRQSITTIQTKSKNEEKREQEREKRTNTEMSARTVSW